jgi:hypothetical protein
MTNFLNQSGPDSMLERASWCLDDVTSGTNNQVKEYGTQYLHMSKKKKIVYGNGPKKKNVHHPCCVGFLSPSRDEFKELSEKISFLICKKLCRFVG